MTNESGMWNYFSVARHQQTTVDLASFVSVCCIWCRSTRLAPGLGLLISIFLAVAACSIFAALLTVVWRHGRL